MHKSTLFACALTVAIASTSNAQVSPELYDYLVQDVCIDSSQQAIAGDPATCANRRDIGVYEPSPYIMTDYDTVFGVSYSGFNSIPVQGEDGQTRIMTVKSLEGGFDANYTYSFNAARGDGFDLADISFSNYASFIRTFDGGCFDQLWSRRPGGTSPSSRAGGWILFPLTSAPSTWPLINSRNQSTYKIQLSNVAGCSNGSSNGVTYWNPPANYQFETNKVLRAIRSDHFASQNLSSQNNALERFYFTKEYGFTRWEAWVPRSRCIQEAAQVPAFQLRPDCYPEYPWLSTPPAAPEVDLRARCQVMNVSATPEPDIDRWGGQDWVRVDCRDQTRYVELNTPVLMLNTTLAQGNGVDDIAYPSSGSGGSNPPLGPPNDGGGPPGTDIDIP